MRYVIGISEDAHKVVMTATTPGSYEYQSEAQFFFYIYNNGGSRHAAYTSICGSGPNSAILHYGHAGSPNDRRIEDGDMCCYDMGAQYFGYAADITCSFPTNGVFTDDQKIVYNTVLNANRAAQAASRPGDWWSSRQEIDDMISAGLGRVFQPHGLSHFLGLDVHDVGAGVAGYKNHLPNRFIRAMLPGMVFTIEPGCYFIDPLLDEALNNPAQSRFIVGDVLERFRGSGGVRIEDVVLVNEDGVENLTQIYLERLKD
ncbi:xaa-pro aminopeptidase 3 [Holotrichia oblita]|uniref:Xaa-pro aminopeptidase 3 n=1 Tax=Holotrichia oblita TaxID=644536 RepID=A0ACB9TIR9_HOLOL|nr:xaa-pro aminopeptidase 3 [Holotrichia oblita]